MNYDVDFKNKLVTVEITPIKCAVEYCPIEYDNTATISYRLFFSK